MSEDDRAAKAARAKAMLKKRQAKKAGTPSGSTPGITSPVSERAFSPAPPELALVPEPEPEPEKRDISDVFVADDNNDTSWLSSLTRVGTPPPAPPPPTTAVAPDSSPPLSADFTSTVLNGRQALQLQEEINRLKKESEALCQQIERLESDKSEYQKSSNSAKSENETLIVKLRSLETARSDWGGRELSFKTEVDALRANLAQAEASKSNLQRTETNLRAENKNMKTTLNELEAAKAKLQQSENALKMDIEQLKSDLTGKLDNATSKLQQTEKTLEEQRQHSSQVKQQIEQLRAETEASLRNEQQTISLLVSEKATLASDLERLSNVESGAQETERMLAEEQLKTSNLEEHLQQLRSEIQDATTRIQNLEGSEKTLTDKTKDQERQLQIANGSLTSSRKEAEKHRRRVRELEEQIQSDDRADRLEASLKNTQDRADELEFQLSKLKQTHSSLRSERDELESRIRMHRDGEDEWKSKYSDLYAQHQTLDEQLAKSISEKESLTREKLLMHTEMESRHKALALLQEKLSTAATELAASSRQLQVAQNEAKIANRRAEDAERTQRELQDEGTNLMHSLDEMRPKIVELTGVKLTLTEKVDALEHVIHNREVMIGELEGNLEEVQAAYEASTKKLQDLLSAKEMERLSSQDNESELQKAYGQLKAELESSLANVRSLEADRTISQHDTIRHMEEVERLQQLSSTQAEELSSIQQELNHRQTDESEEKNFLDVAQNEIESLRQELAIRDEELERLRLRTSISSSFPDKPHSLKDELNDEVLNSLKLELSSSKSHVRSLEESMFEAEARSHALMKQVAALEDQLAARLQLPSFSPSGPSRPSSRGSRVTASHRPSTLARSAIEHNLSPETRHKRKASLSMLKARIDSELAAASGHCQIHSRALSPVQSVSSSGDKSSIVGSRPRSPTTGLNMLYSQHRSRPQILDDSHVFWCSSCRGDLVIL